MTGFGFHVQLEMIRNAIYLEKYFGGQLDILCLPSQFNSSVAIAVSRTDLIRQVFKLLNYSQY